MQDHNGPSASVAGASVALVAVLGAIYVFSQFLRNSVGVIAPDLARELHLSASEIGLLSSVFFAVFAGAQIPLGISLDRYGPRICMLVCAAIAIAGAILFGLGSSPATLIAARMLMGIGSSCFLMAPLALYAKRFPPERFSMLVGIQLGLGTIGTLLATAPLAYSAAAIGWRNSFLASAALMALVTVLVAVIVREEGVKGATAHRETLRESLSGLREALRRPDVGRLFLMQLATHSSFLLVAGLWGGPYLTHIYGYSLAERGQMLFVAAVAQSIGSVLWGQSDFVMRGYKMPVLIGGVLTIASLAFAAVGGKLSGPLLLGFFLSVGLFSAFVSVLIAHGKALFPPQLVGRGLTLLNIGTMGGVFLSQTVSGIVIDLFPSAGGAYPLEAYRWVFGLQAAFLAVACLAYLGARDARAAVSGADAVASPKRQER